MLKKIGFVFSIIFLIGLISVGARHFYIKSIFLEPYKVVEELVQAADQDKSENAHIISEKKWEEISEDSIFSAVRKPVDWNGFKRFIQGCKGPRYSLEMENGKAATHVMKQHYEDTSKSIAVLCMEFDVYNGQQVGLTHMTFYMEKIQGDWKVIGRW
ncbi:hypothetical protein AB685_15440 [Bacillus sp. LL01]|uniref:hypothetical protein n=1 Tax=Bacillus sp. LL01 TaxID=1665556 RepID=UPI00064CED8F|nr:hypothetical protein [Bacillus sp. LL01]KMJ57420.1 hypothetical protein AB685_15440 [Bacillus sp. LL01]